MRLERPILLAMVKEGATPDKDESYSLPLLGSALCIDSE